MKYKLLTLSIFLSIVSFSFAQQKTTINIPSEADQLQNPVKDNPAMTMRGAKYYKKVCLVCHGPQGKGDGPQAVEIATKPADFADSTIVNRTDGALFWWISNGGNDMQPFKDVLAPRDIWSLVNYVRKLQAPQK